MSNNQSVREDIPEQLDIAVPNCDTALETHEETATAVPELDMPSEPNEDVSESDYSEDECVEITRRTTETVVEFIKEDKRKPGFKKLFNYDDESQSVTIDPETVSIFVGRIHKYMSNLLAYIEDIAYKYTCTVINKRYSDTGTADEIKKKIDELAHEWLKDIVNEVFYEIPEVLDDKIIPFKTYRYIYDIVCGEEEEEDVYGCVINALLSRPYVHKVYCNTIMRDGYTDETLEYVFYHPDFDRDYPCVARCLLHEDGIVCISFTYRLGYGSWSPIYGTFAKLDSLTKSEAKEMLSPKIIYHYVRILNDISDIIRIRAEIRERFPELNTPDYMI